MSQVEILERRIVIGNHEIRQEGEGFRVLWNGVDRGVRRTLGEAVDATNDDLRKFYVEVANDIMAEIGHYVSIEDGLLTIRRDDDVVAAFAPGHWRHVTSGQPTRGKS